MEAKKRRKAGKQESIGRKSKIAYTGTALLLVLLLIFLICFCSFMKKTLEEAEQNGKKLISEMLLREEQQLREYEKVLRMAGFSVTNLQSRDADREEILQWLEQYTSYVDTLDNGYYAVYGYINGDYLSGIGWVPGPDYQVEERQWYRLAIEADGAVAFSDVYQDAYSGRNVISISRKINEAGDVLSIDLFTDDMEKAFSKDVNLEKSMQILLDRQGTVVAHKHVEGEEVCLLKNSQYAKNVLLAVENKESLESSEKYTDIRGAEWMLYASDVYNGWKFIMLVPFQEVMSSAYELIAEQLIMLAAVLLVLSLLLLYHREDKKNAARIQQIMEVLGNTYFSIYLLDLAKGRYEIIKTIWEIEEAVKPTGPYWVLEKALLSLLPEESGQLFCKHYSLDQMRSYEQVNEKSKAIELKQNANGTSRWVDCHLLRMPEFEKRHEVLLAFRMIHEEKVRELEQQKLLTESLDMARDSSQAKSDFLSRMSHDMRTPMNAIIGYTGLAREYAGQEERVREYLGKIDFSSKQMLSLVNDVLEMSKIEQKTMELKEESFSFREHVQTLLQSFADQAALRGIVFEKDLRLCHSYVKGDVMRIDQIFNNLLSNALKYTPSGGRVAVLVEEKEQTGSRYSLYRIEVKDTGVGMSEEFLRREFRPFEREDNPDLRGVEGTGLGMAIVKNVVQLLNGTMEVKSTKGKGSSFTVTIPLLWQAQAPAEAVKPGQERVQPENVTGTEEPITLRGRHFLVVEDNEINLEIILEMMKMWDCVCVAAHNGKEAVEYFAAQPEGTFDVILMDIQMPVMNGYEATVAIRGLDRPDAAAIPIFAITANAFSDDVARALEAGMNDHISKPIDFEQLKKLLAQRLPRR